MSTVTFDTIRAKVEELRTLPSSCPELKAVCTEWLKAVGTDRQQEMNAKLLKEAEEDINTLDDVIPFFESDAGRKAFGEKTAAQLAQNAHELKAEGKKYCFCPSCTICLFILENKEVLL
jgi:hypothetical protein